jgi:GT2 family glycosyltransferase
MSFGLEILFASHDGARTLPRMLAALERLESPATSWRILAVDNASTDDTPAILADAALRLPLVPLACGEPGKMPALKLAIARSTAPLIVFTDDDVEPVPGWLAAYVREATAHPEAGLFGGPIVPMPMEPLGAWYEQSATHHSELFARSDQPDGPIDAAAHVYGPNFMIRREHLEAFDKVAPGLGPTFTEGRSRTFAMGEDTQIMELLKRRGAAARYVRAAAVNHLVRAFQAELAFMLDRAERHGRGTSIRLVEAKGRSLARRLRLALEHAPRSLSSFSEARAPTPGAFDNLWRARWSLGMVKGALFGPYPRG